MGRLERHHLGWVTGRSPDGALVGFVTVEWLHVDVEPHLRGFSLQACGFTSTGAGLIPL